MDISTSTNLVAFQPGKMRNPMEFCIEECAKGGYKVLDINFCECMNPYSRMRNDDWETYVKELGELGKRWGVTFRQSHLPYYDVFKEPELNQTMEELIRRSIIASAMLGVEWTVTHPGTVYSAGLYQHFVRCINGCIRGIGNDTVKYDAFNAVGLQ